MQPQGTSLTNASQYDALKKKVEACASCKDLQSVSTEILTSLEAETQAIQDQVDKLAPISALLTPPDSPEDVVTWISDFITGFLQPLAAPAIQYPLQIAERTAAIAELTDTINKKSEEFANCSIDITP